jgi:magnesium transporter
MIRTLRFTETGTDTSPMDVQAIKDFVQNDRGLLWLDIADETPETSRQVLSQAFNFHPLAIDDAIEEIHVPKIDDWGNYLYTVFHEMTLSDKPEIELQTHELDVFIGANFIVTYHAESMPALERVWANCQRDEQQAKKGAGNLVYKLVDEIVDGYLSLMDQMDDMVDQIEDQIFENPQTRILEKLFQGKRTLLNFRRIIMPLREVLNKLSRGDFTVVPVKDRNYYRDIYDHLVRLYDISENLRDMMTGALDTYLSVVNNRMNDIMKTLTVITTFFMPITFITGFFGMNFFQPINPFVVLVSKIAFIVVAPFFIIVPIFMYFWMRRRAWL